MVAAVENLTRLEGTILSRSPHERLDGWDEVVLQVTGTQSVPGKADLVSARRGTEPLHLAVRRDLLGAAGPGSRLTARARLAAGDVLAEPYPQAGDFEVATGEVATGDVATGEVASGEVADDGLGRPPS